MRHAIGWIYHVLAWLILVGVLGQFYTAGVGLFGAGTMSAHLNLGRALDVPILILPLLAAVGRLGWRPFGLSALLYVVYIVQVSLPLLRSDAAFVAALHPLNAVALLVVTGLAIWQRTYLAKG